MIPLCEVESFGNNKSESLLHIGEMITKGLERNRKHVGTMCTQIV